MKFCAIKFLSVVMYINVFFMLLYILDLDSLFFFFWGGGEDLNVPTARQLQNFSELE